MENPLELKYIFAIIWKTDRLKVKVIMTRKQTVISSAIDMNVLT